jgi:hypothetical protein
MRSRTSKDQNSLAVPSGAPKPRLATSLGECPSRAWKQVIPADESFTAGRASQAARGNALASLRRARYAACDAAFGVTSRVCANCPLVCAEAARQRSAFGAGERRQCVEHAVDLFADQEPRLGIARGLIRCRKSVDQSEGSTLIR